MAKATDGDVRMFEGFGGGEATERSAFGKTALVIAAVLALPIGGWLLLRPAPSEPVAIADADEERSADAAKPSDKGTTLANRQKHEAADPTGLAPTEAARTEAATRESAAKALAPVELAVEPTAVPEPARKPARKRSARPKSPTPPAPDKPKQTSGMGPL